MISSLRQEQASRTAAVRFLFVLLAWSQLSFAAHQFEHSHDEAAESCAVCLLFDRQDDIVPVPDCQTQTHAAAPAESSRSQVERRTHAFTPYLSRASP